MGIRGIVLVIGHHDIETVLSLRIIPSACVSIAYSKPAAPSLHERPRHKIKGRIALHESGSKRIKADAAPRQKSGVRRLWLD